jgi:hypothetical protein
MFEPTNSSSNANRYPGMLGVLVGSKEIGGAVTTGGAVAMTVTGALPKGVPILSTVTHEVSMAVSAASATTAGIAVK